MRRKPLYSLIAMVVFFFFISASASGAGFALVEQSVSGLGNAYAGGSASAEDATTIFYNPAGMALLKKQELIAGGHIIMPSAKFRNEGSTHLLQQVTGMGLVGGNGGDAGVTGFVPNLYYVYPLTKVVIGIGINSPFGLATEYDPDWVGRYHAIKSEVRTVNINPAIAYMVNDYIALGWGINLQYLKAELSNAIDFGTLDAIGAFSALGLPAGALGLLPQQADGYVNLEGDSWGLGYNFGVMVMVNDRTRLGASYRSRIKHNISGDADFSNVPAGLQPFPLFKDTGANADIRLPDSLSIGFYHTLSDSISIMGDITWMGWSVLDELRFSFDNPYQEDGVTTTAWKDTFRYSLGLTYRANKKITIRTGIAYDETPIPDAAHRTPRIPDGDRLWTALGLGYRFGEVFDFDIAYAHLFVNDPEIRKTPTGENVVRGGLNGTYDAHVDILSAQLRVTF